MLNETEKNIYFLKKQTKMFFKDWKTEKQSIGTDGSVIYNYDCKFYDVKKILSCYGRHEEDIKLMKAQHIIAVVLGFKKWNDLIQTSESELKKSASILLSFRIRKRNEEV